LAYFLASSNLRVSELGGCALPIGWVRINLSHFNPPPRDLKPSDPIRARPPTGRPSRLSAMLAGFYGRLRTAASEYNDLRPLQAMNMWALRKQARLPNACLHSHCGRPGPSEAVEGSQSRRVTFKMYMLYSKSSAQTFGTHRISRRSQVTERSTNVKRILREYAV
jgi:hypothetical protein